MAEAREGRCQCGTIRYRIEGEPGQVIVCHCMECQKQSSSAFGMSVVLPLASFKLLSGTLKQYKRVADSGRENIAHFCPECGNRIYHTSPAAPGMMRLKPGTLDDTSWLKPTMQLWTARMQRWVSMPEGIKSHERQP